MKHNAKQRGPDCSHSEKNVFSFNMSPRSTTSQTFHMHHSIHICIKLSITLRRYTLMNMCLNTLLTTNNFTLRAIQYKQNVLEQKFFSPYRVIGVRTTHEYKKSMQQSPCNEVGIAKTLISTHFLF